MEPTPAFVVWITGLPASGKTTTASALYQALSAAGHHAFVLDGDRLRRGLNSDLGFSAADRRENIRRVAEVARLFADAGVICIAAFISPYRADRDFARQAVGGARFLEVYLDVPVAVCERRDPKGHYRRARAGELREFTGVSAPYEPPAAADVTLDTEREGVAGCTATVLRELQRRGLLPRGQIDTAQLGADLPQTRS